MNTLPHNTRRLEQDIVKAMLEKLAKIQVEYPVYLHDPTKARYLQQITTKKAVAAGTTTARS